ncbi:hypothetical protein ABC502_03865 [Alkalimonas sp. NCh-2]|uniref:hypothetical protein n=1 Tax=Alkalimonas sp. NCh-2 TaxID=3144846 RepID=UPI0031F65DA9
MGSFLRIGRACLLMLSTVILVACGGSDSGSTSPPQVKTQPDPFSFTAQSDVEPGTMITSNSITVSGINTATTISIQNGEYSINNADFTSNSATVNNAAQIRVRHQASGQFATSQSTTLVIGGVSANFVTTTRSQSPPVGNDTPPEATVIFPWSQSKTSAGVITVRGTATSRNGISQLNVNGIPASIQNPAVLAQRVSSKSVSTQSDDVDGAETYDWTAEIQIEAYTDVELVVSVSDLSGNQDDEAAKVRTNTQQAPRYIAYDAVNQRYIGMMDNRDVVAIDAADLSVEVIRTVGEVSQFVLAPDGSRLFYSRFMNDTLFLIELDLNNGEIGPIVSYQPQLTEGTMITHVRTQINFNNQIAYISLGLSEPNTDFFTDKLYRVDMQAETIYLLSRSQVDDLLFLPLSEIIWHNNSLMGLSINGLLIEVEPVTGDRNQIFSLSNSPFKLAAGATDNELFIAGFTNISKLTLLEREVTIISEESPSSQFPTSQISDVVLQDSATLLVADSSFEVVLKVDTSSGERSSLLSSGIGSGRGLLSPQFMTLANTADTLYVLDDGQNAAESLFAIDLSTGNRTQLIEIDREFNTYPSGLFYNATNDTLLVGLSDAIWSVSLSDNSKTVISDAETGAGSPIAPLNGGDFDTVTQTLYMAQAPLENAILQIDAISGDRSLLQFDGSAGPAGIITGLNAIALDAGANQLYLASQSQSSIYRLDLETLETVLLLDSCENSIGQNVLDIDTSGISKINFDATANRLLILASQIASYDFVTGQCQIVGHSSEYFNALPLDNGTFLTLGQAALKQLDPVTQKQVILSK